MKKSILCSLVGLCLSLQALPTVEKPRFINTHTVVHLSKDSELSGNGSPFIATKKFGASQPEKLIITSKTGSTLRVKKESTWDLTSFKGENQVIEFAGNARLVCEQGATLKGQGVILRFSDEAEFIVEK